MPFHKYKPFRPLSLPDRTWPDNFITQTPRWCSVDLRDGNQALIEPMTPDEKQQMWDLLVEIGFKEIEVGFPSASQTDFDFVRKIIEENRIPDDVTIQILCQARRELIERSCEAVAGAKNVIFHLYNSTSALQRKVVFNMERSEITKLATDATEIVKRHTEPLIAAGTNLTLEYSPESYTATEVDYAVEICDAVMKVWEPTVENKVILNLPSTVEMGTPNLYADQIEYFIRNLPEREKAVVSLHTHNDRGTGVAASEMGLMAGAERIEGTLFGNGERTGNLDIITMAMNLFSQGIDPGLYLADMAKIVSVSEECTKIPIHVRQPYAGELVFTAFSGSHQDAIKKGMAFVEEGGDSDWEVPYLPIDPSDVGGHYRETVRVNSQSGKGGVAFILENFFGVTLPRPLLLEFSPVVQALSEADGGELKADVIWNAFVSEYIEVEGPYQLVDYQVHSENDEKETCQATVQVAENTVEVKGAGSGPIDAFINAMVETLNEPLNVVDYQEYALKEGSEAQAICILALNDEDGEKYYGVGISQNTTTAAFKSIIAAINRKWR
ncbi:MAG: 2-isopropylmalate synthase [Gammaproteobacteria bacterium]|nr:2-isopropylmalate synthase [Gammaproteobacteria bacterium]MBT4493953.1 2-isopropylmalate synthase [Gammaproteobacteria bacterium]MBT7369127.1 2-isopropylmalate synthase [Gammaproteobacteria bacterium]